MRDLIISSKKNKGNDKGFTLVELIVVLVLMAILAAISVAGILTWQDWTRFKKENTGAETIFYAAQNQFSELAATGMYEEKVYGVLERLGNDIGNPGEVKLFDGSTIKYASGATDYYKWQPDGSSNGIALWANTPDVAQNEKKKYQGSIYYLSAKKGDYNRYLKEPDFGESPDDAGARLLFDLIASYISEKSVLNGAIILEFSPEARQVFSVCYSDRIDELTYKELTTNTSSLSSVRDRSEETRRDLMLGYFAAQSLSVPLEGMGKTVLSNVELRNEYALKLVIREDTITYDEPYIITLCNAPGGIVDSNSKLMTFAFTPKNTIPGNPVDASQRPQSVTIKFLSGKNIGNNIQMQIPAWVETVSDETVSDGKKELILALDAADVQAQSFLYAEKDQIDSSFFNTYSFYRYGFNMDDITSVGCLVSKGVGESVSRSNAECPTFKEITKSGTDAEYSIENGRHLYNVRYETDWEKGEIDKTFRLTTDIDWEEFTGVTNSGTNWFFDSYGIGRPSGINYEGVQWDINRATHSGTAGYAFPGFRVLGTGDVFTGLKKNAGETDKPFTISNLTITFSGNMRYGVYGKDSRDEWIDETLALNTFGVYDTQTVYGGKHPTQKRVVKGELPLGLFAENAGDITGLRLNKHKVIGEEILHDAKTGNDVLVYTNMVGGFTGNNLGKLSNLTLRDTTNPAGDDAKADEAGISLVTGKTDVGGIVGRQSWTMSDADVTLTKLYNYASVKGMENVGGIVGRAYAIRPFTSRGNNDLAVYNERKAYYSDPYTIFGEFDNNGNITPGNPIGGTVSVNLAETITIEDCHNRGHISGSSDFNVLHNEAANRGIYDETEIPTDPKVSKRMIQRCANIGGIAGITMDGFFLENKDKAGSQYWYYYIKTADLKVKVKNCDSYHLYTENEWNEVRSSDTKASITDEEIKNSIEHDYYVGGLVGYARLTQFTDCSNKKAEADNEGNYESFVFGRNYVGGMFGCFDGSRIGKTANQGRYNAENYVNTIGIMYVGGFSGSFGIGAEDIKKISFRYPSENTGSEATPIPGDDETISGICNRAVVLGAKRERFTADYKSGSFLYNQDRAITGGVTKGGTRAVSGAPDSCVGGVIGLAASKFTDFDNLQDDSAKTLALKLAGFGDTEAKNRTVDAHSLETVWNNSLYGGNAVGGIVGKILNNVDVNANKNCYSKVDAVVWGGDATGGIWGATSNVSSNNRVNVYNAYFDGAIVLGRDMVGGIGGRGTAGFNVNSTYANAAYLQNHPVHVAGRYAVGGAFGYTGVHSVSSTTIRASLDGGAESKIIVEGIAAAGGFSGAVGNVSTYEGYVKNAIVKADFYSGGVFGVMYNEYDVSFDKGGIEPSVPLNNKNLYAENVNVVADSAFAGGYCGLYQYRKEHVNKTSDDFCQIYPLFKTLTNYANDANTFITFLDELVTVTKGQDYYNAIIAAVNASETNDTGALNPKMDLTTKEQNFPCKPVRGGSVTAKIFAGGVFGYVPNGMRFTFTLLGKDNDNAGNIRVTTQECVSADKLPDAWMEKDAKNTTDFGDRRFSYAGGVIGRIPMGCTINNAAYQGVINSNKGTYLGQIAEVSEGTVQNCTISGYLNGSSNNTFTGGLVGLNSINGVMGTGNSFYDGMTLGVTTGDNDTKIVREIVGGFAGENISRNLKMENIRFVDGNITAIQGKTAAGLICGYNSANGIIDTYSSGGTVITSSIRMVDTPYAGVYAGINAGLITNSKISELKKNVSDLTADEIIQNSLNAEMSALRCNHVGLLTGKNLGIISYICINGANGDRRGIIKTDNAYNYLGGIAGQNGEGIARTATIQDCITTMAVGNADKVGTAAGMAAFINGNSTIKNCINKANVSGKDNAGGIAGKAGTSMGANPSVTFENCVNLGTLAVTEAAGNTAGIAVGTNQEGNFTLCRNYGTGAKFGISAENVKGMTMCLDNSGLNEGTTENPAHPLAPNERAEGAFVRNFYISGTTDDITVPDNPGETADTIKLSINESIFDLVSEIDEDSEAWKYKKYSWEADLETAYFNGAVGSAVVNYFNGVQGYGDNTVCKYILLKRFDSDFDTMNSAFMLKLYAYYKYYKQKSVTEVGAQEFIDYMNQAIAKGKLEPKAEDPNGIFDTGVLSKKFNAETDHLISDEALHYILPGHGYEAWNEYAQEYQADINKMVTWDPEIIVYYKHHYPEGTIYNTPFEFREFIGKVYAEYMYTNRNKVGFEYNYDELRAIVVSILRGAESGPDDLSHWPVQLYYYGGDDGTKGLYFKRKYFHYAGIDSDLDPANLDDTTAEGRFNLIDAKFVTMVNKTDGEEGYIPNYSADDSTAPVGFVKQ